MDVKIESSWKQKLQEEFEKPYFQKLTETIRAEYLSGKKIYPEARNIFNAFALCPFDQVKVVILGQDPYHGPRQAHGLCFSVQDGVDVPPSLQNIYKEIHSDLGIAVPKSGNLERWATQGVLLLNATLTVEAGKAGSHQKKGWEEFTSAVIAKLAEEKEHLVFLLWGSYAQKKASFVDPKKHYLLQTVHPSPLSSYRGFFGCRHFSKTNQYLRQQNLPEIQW